MESNLPKSIYNDSDNGIIEKQSEIHNFEDIKDAESFNGNLSSESMDDNESEESGVKLNSGSNILFNNLQIFKQKYYLGKNQSFILNFISN